MKNKGSRTERELFHKFWDSGLSAVRVAGSGSTPLPAPDLLASNSSRVFAIECKALKSSKKYFKEGEIEQLIEFATKFGAEPWVAMKFNNKGWFFVHASQVEKTKNNINCISLKLAQEKGIRFDDFIK